MHGDYVFRYAQLLIIDLIEGEAFHGAIEKISLWPSSDAATHRTGESSEKLTAFFAKRKPNLGCT